MPDQNQTKLYESFHSANKLQKSLVDETDFTQGPLLRLLQTYFTKKKQQVLDIGCGTGAKDFYLVQKGHQVTGVDISPSAIEMCQQNAKLLKVEKQTRFITTDLESFNTKDKFDLILLIEVIEHLKDDRGALVKINKLLNVGGLLVLSTPSIHAPLYKLGFLGGFDKRVGHLRRYDPEQLKQMVAKQFEIKEFIKTEGILRNFLYTSTIGGKILLRLINRSKLLQHIYERLDQVSLRLFGESDYIIIAEKRR